MSRGRRGRLNEGAGVRPAEKIELEEKSPKKRIVLAVILLAVGLGLIGYSIFSALGQKGGWTQIGVTETSAESVASEFVLLYELGASGRSPAAENRELSRLYTELCAEAYRIFHADRGFEEVHNLYYWNRHIGEPVELEPALYEALETVEAYGNRFLFAAPFYREYKNLFQDTEDGSAALVDPYKSEEIAAYFRELSAFTSDEAHVRVELLGDGRAVLFVSDEFAAFAKENGIDTFVDLYWARNAFAADYIAEGLSEQGFVFGSLSSYDGFTRVLDARGGEYAQSLYSLYDGVPAYVGQLCHVGPQSTVCLRSFRMNAEEMTYYLYQTGERRHPYVDVNDGLCKNAWDMLVSYSRERSCVEVLLSMLPAFLAEEPNEARLAEIRQDGVYSLYVSGETVFYNETGAVIKNLFDDGTLTYSLCEIAP